jgi:hypothetical protein
MAETTAPAARRRLWPGLCSCPDVSSAAAASLGGSQAWRDGSHRSSRISATRLCWASTSRAMPSAVAAASAVAAYKKTPVFPAVTETSSPARLRSRSQTESAKTRFPEANWPQAIRLTRHSSPTLQAYAKRMLQAPHRHALSPCRRTEIHDLCEDPARSGASSNHSESAVYRTSSVTGSQAARAPADLVQRDSRRQELSDRRSRLALRRGHRSRLSSGLNPHDRCPPSSPELPAGAQGMSGRHGSLAPWLKFASGHGCQSGDEATPVPVGSPRRARLESGGTGLQNDDLLTAVTYLSTVRSKEGM